MDTPSIPQKRCTKCNNEFPATLEYFGPDKRGYFGLTGECRICHRLRNAKYRNQNRDEIRRRGRSYQSNLPKELKNQRMREWRVNNPQKAKDADRRHKEKHRDRIRQYSRTKYWENPEYYRHRAKIWAREHKQQMTHTRHSSATYRVIWLRYRARKHNLPDNFTVDDWQNCLVFFDHRCAVCNRPIGFWNTLAADHWIPLTGANCPGTVPENIIPLCQGIDGCNNQKSNRNAEEWLNEKVGAKQAKRILTRIQAYFAQVSSDP